MVVVNPLALKIIFGSSAATCVGAAAIIYRNQINEFVVNQIISEEIGEQHDVTHQLKKNEGTFEQEKIDDNNILQEDKDISTFLIIKTKETINQIIDDPLYEDDGTKNFQCEIDKKQAQKCEILEITRISSNKLNNLNDINNSHKKATKDILKDDRFFKLTISNSLLENIKWDGTQVVDILSNKRMTNENSGKYKKYGSFFMKYRIVNGKVEGKTNLILAKIIEKKLDKSLNDEPNFSCLLNDEIDRKDCSIYKLKYKPTKTNDVVLSGIKKATKNDSDYEVGNYYVFDLKNKVSELSGDTFLVVNQDSQKTSIANFQFLGALSETSSDFSENNFSQIIFN